jgi:hypothetical protein
LLTISFVYLQVFEDAVLVDWHQSFLEQGEIYSRFELAIGTDEGKSDILNFEDVGMNGQVHRKGLDLDQFEDYFITLKACRPDGRCSELCVKAHALKGQSCVHRRLIVGDGFVTITKGESIRSFFEHAEEAEEEDVSGSYFKSLTSNMIRIIVIQNLNMHGSWKSYSLIQ